MDINTMAEILRKEKRSPYLQEISKDFYSQLETFVTEFYKEYPLHTKERENLEKIIADLYNARERKIVLSALSFSRFGKEQDITNLVPEEEKTFNDLLKILQSQREQFLQFSSKKSSSSMIEKSNEKVKTENLKKVESETKTSEKPMNTKVSEKKTIPKNTVRILEEIPQIVGVDGKTYGSFKAEDVVTLPEANAKIFIKKGMAELIDFPE